MASRLSLCFYKRKEAKRISGLASLALYFKIFFLLCHKYLLDTFRQIGLKRLWIVLKEGIQNISNILLRKMNSKLRPIQLSACA